MRQIVNTTVQVIAGESAVIAGAVNFTGTTKKSS